MTKFQCVRRCHSIKKETNHSFTLNCAFGTRTSFVGAIVGILHALLLRPPAPRRDARHPAHDFESFANALGALPNQPPVPMACEPSPSPIDTKAIVQQVVDVLLKHSPSPAVHLEVLGRRWLALARNESVTNLTSTLLPAKVPAMKKRDKRARAVLELMPVTPSCPQATIALLMSKASTHRSAADINVLRRCGNRAVQLAEAGLKQPTSATSKVVSAETIQALDAHRAAEANAGKIRAWMRSEDVALLELHAGDLPVSTHHPALANRSHSARRSRMFRLQKHVGGLFRLQKHVGGLVRATFSNSITNQAGPLLELHYDRWTRLAPDLALTSPCPKMLNGQSGWGKSLVQSRHQVEI